MFDERARFVFDKLYKPDQCIQKLFAVCKKLESNYSTLEFLFFD